MSLRSSQVDKKKKEIAEHKKILVKEVVVQRGRVEYFSERNKLLESSIERKKAKITGLKTTISELRGALENKEVSIGADIATASGDNPTRAYFLAIRASHPPP